MVEQGLIKEGLISWVWNTLGNFGFGVLTINSVLAINRSHGDLSSISFVFGAYLDLAFSSFV
mgnify:CR=1 FL=1